MSQPVPSSINVYTYSHILAGLVSQWTRLWDGWPRNQGPYPDRGKENFLFSKASIWLWDPRSLLISGQWVVFPQG